MRYTILLAIFASFALFYSALPHAVFFADAQSVNQTEEVSVAPKANRESKEEPERKGKALPALAPLSGLIESQVGTQSTSPQSLEVEVESAPVQSLEVQISALGANLIANPSFQSADSSGNPVGWKKGGYGTNTRTHSYPVAGMNDDRAARVSISSWTSGDAKWYFDDVAVVSGKTYEYSDFSVSNVTTELDIRYTMTNGAFTYVHLQAVPPSSSFQKNTARFTVPANAAKITVFHSVSSVGTLTTDSHSLAEVTDSPPPPPPPTEPPPAGNLITNPTFRTADGSGNPVGWKKGGYGINNRTFSYPVSGSDDNAAARVAITSWTSGDVKWYFNDVPVSPGEIYEFADDSLSNVITTIGFRYTMTDGTFRYGFLASVSPGSTWKRTTVRFTAPSGASSVTIFHALNRVGTLTVDNYSLSPVSAGGGSSQSIFQTGAVTLRFDDGDLNQYQNAIPKLNAAGYKGTFYIVSRQIADNGYTGYMSKAQIQQLAAQGHEIGGHTRTHPHLTNLSSTAQRDEISGGRQDLLSWNVGPVLSFAYPYGEYDSTTMQIVSDAGFESAGATIDGYVTASSDLFQLERQSAEVNTSVAQMKQWIDHAIANKEWLILTFHDIDTSGGQYSITPSNFNQVIDYLKSKNARVLTATEALNTL